MGKLPQGLRRFWGIRPGELERPATMLGEGRTMGAPRSGPQGRGRLRRLLQLRPGPRGR